jgi:hypothetical protein
VFLAMLLVTMALLAAGSPLQAALGPAIVAAGVPVYRLVVSPRGHDRAAGAPLEEA